MTPKNCPGVGSRDSVLVRHLWAAGLGKLLVGLWVTGRHQSCLGEKPNPGSLQVKLLLLTEPPALSLQSLPATRGRK